MEKCRYFSEEDTQLKYIGRKLGATVDRTPKFRPELEGKGIKYLWGISKSLYNMLKLKDNRGKENFLKIVCHCISHDIITTELVRN